MNHFTKRISALLCCALLLCGCGATTTTETTSSAPEPTKEILQEAYIHLDANSDPEYDYYNAYSATGELMFTLREYPYETAACNGITSAYWYTADTVQYGIYSYPKESYLMIVDSLKDNENHELRNDSVILYQEELQYLSVKEFSFSSDYLTSTDTITTYTSSTEGNPVTTRSTYDAEGRILEAYNVNSDGEEYLMTLSEYNADGQVIKRTNHSFDSDGSESVTVLAYTYDAEGNLLTYENRNETTGEISSSLSYTRTLNEDGTVATQTSTNTLTGDTSTNTYYYMTIAEKTFSDEYVGYWQMSDTEYTYFLELSCNGLICVGSFNPSFGIMVPQIYGFYELAEDGTLTCELYENGCIAPEEYLQGTIYLQDGQLVFNTLVFDKVR